MTRFREVLEHYGVSDERGRLSVGSGPLELVRTLELLSRHLPPPPARVADVGGAAGAYASLLARRGYEVHLVDFVPLHVEQAHRAFDDLADTSFATATIADARRLPFRAHEFDVVLLLGPLYHLTEKDDRIHTIGEALRILRGSGLIFAAAISRFASTYDGIARGFLSDENFRRIVEADVANGQHRNPTEHPDYFTTAYFHHPEELAEELVAAGSTLDGVFAIEGPASWLADYDYWVGDRYAATVC